MRGRFLFVAAVLIAGCGEPIEPVPKAPVPPDVPVPPRDVRLEAVTPTELTGVVGTALTSDPTIRAVDSTGRPVAGVVVVFDVGNTGGGVANHAIGTDIDGLASAGRWTLGTWAGDQILAVHTGGRTHVQFKARANPGPPRTLGRSGGNVQVGTARERLASPLRVRVGDVFGNPVPGAPVTFIVVSGGGRIEGDSALTDADGTAVSGPWILGPSSGVQRVSARTAVAEVEFSAFACGDCPPLLFVRGPYIYKANGFHGDEEQLTFGSEPAWSPDGQRIAFVRYDVDDVGDIYLMNANGSNIVRRTFGGVRLGFRSPAWSPDGRRLAVTGGAGSETTVYVIGVDDYGASPVPIARMASHPAWSPDGRRIAFVSLGWDGDDALHVIDADGSNDKALTSRGEYASLDRPAWSPDGRRLVVSKCLVFECDLFTIGDDGAQIGQLTSRRGAFSPTWSSNGAWIAFTQRNVYEPQSVGSIALVPADTGGDPFTLVPSGLHPAWRP